MLDTILASPQHPRFVEQPFQQLHNYKCFSHDFWISSVHLYNSKASGNESWLFGWNNKFILMFSQSTSMIINDIFGFIIVHHTKIQCFWNDLIFFPNDLLGKLIDFRWLGLALRVLCVTAGNAIIRHVLSSNNNYYQWI